MFKKFGKILLLLVFCTAAVALPMAYKTVYVEADGVAEIAMELTSGKVFHSKNAEKRLPKIGRAHV